MTDLVFIYGSVASGKLTIARELAALTGFAVFHNHLVVDAVASVFPFGTERFSRLREQFWLTMMREAGEAGRPIIFTFAPEPSVSPDFPDRVQVLMKTAGHEVAFVRLTVPPLRARTAHLCGEPSGVWKAPIVGPVASTSRPICSL